LAIFRQIFGVAKHIEYLFLHFGVYMRSWVKWGINGDEERGVGEQYWNAET